MIPFILAAALVATPRGIVVAHDHTVEIPGLWRAANGVANPSLVVANDEQAATIDPLANEVAITDLANGKTTIAKTGETPIDALYLDGNLYILNHDSRTLQRGSSTISVAADPAFLRQSRACSTSTRGSKAYCRKSRRIRSPSAARSSSRRSHPTCSSMRITPTSPTRAPEN